MKTSFVLFSEEKNVKKSEANKCYRHLNIKGKLIVVVNQTTFTTMKKTRLIYQENPKS